MEWLGGFNFEICVDSWQKHFEIRAICTVFFRLMAWYYIQKDMREESTFKGEVETNAQLARNFKGYLLLVTGDVDNNVHPGNTLRMANALIQAGKNFDLIVLPGQRHGYQGKASEFYQRRMWFHFAKYLLGDSRADWFYEIDAFDRRH